MLLYAFVWTMVFIFFSPTFCLHLSKYTNRDTISAAPPLRTQRMAFNNEINVGGWGFCTLKYSFGVDIFALVCSLHHLIIPTVIHDFLACCELTTKCMLVVGVVVRMYLDHGVRPPIKVWSRTHIAEKGNVVGGWCW